MPAGHRVWSVTMPSGNSKSEARNSNTWTAFDDDERVLAPEGGGGDSPGSSPQGAHPGFPGIKAPNPEGVLHKRREDIRSRRVDNPFRVAGLRKLVPRVRSLPSRPWAGVCHPVGVKRIVPDSSVVSVPPWFTSSVHRTMRLTPVARLHSIHTHRNWGVS